MYISGKIFHEDYVGDGGYDAESWSSGYPFFEPPSKSNHDLYLEILLQVILNCLSYSYIT